MDDFCSFSITQEGSKHEAGVPCQDASDCNDILENAVFAMVADGHGSSRCFRSDIGSAKAVWSAKKTVEHFIKNISEANINPEDFRTELHGMVKQIINKWFAAVMKDEKTNPLQNDPRLEGIEQKYKDRYLDDIDYRCHAYGTTLIVAAMSNSFWFGFQVGDGKCVVLYEDGSWKIPIPWDDRCTFNTTTSICDDDSLSGFRYWFGLSDEEGGYMEYGYGVEGQGNDYDPNPIKTKARPMVIFIGSDGVEDSYPRVDNDKYIINFYRNRVVTLAENGFESFKEELDSFAKRFADRESTDDVSIAVIIGDVTDKSDMIGKMKQESEYHEMVEQATVKRRDADEKKAALTAVESRTNAITTKQRQLEARIVTIEQDLSSLESKKKSYESAHVKGETEISVSNRDMIDAQNKISMLEGERVNILKEEKLVTARITIAEDEVQKAEKKYNKAKKDHESKKKSLRKGQDAHNKYLRKLSSSRSSAPMAVVTTQRIAGKKTASIVSSTNLKSLQQKVNKLNDELKNSELQALAARQSAEAMSRELVERKRQLEDIQLRTQRNESELEQTKSDYHKLELKNHNQRAAVKRCQSDITKLERQIESKHFELEKLKTELETHRKQTKKQTDTFVTIKKAWEKAEAEAKAMEAAMQKKHKTIKPV